MPPPRPSASPAPRRRRPRRGFAGGPAMMGRLARLHERLRQGERVSAETLARELEVSRRTIKRDIEFLRDHQRTPLAWDATQRTYYYTQPCELLPPLWNSAQEAVTLMLANRTFAAWAGSPLGEVLNSALKKFSSLVGSTMSFSLDSMSEVIFSPVDPPAAEHAHLATVQEAIERRRELRLSYQKARAPAAETRTVHPLHLAHVDSRWMLIAHDVARGDRRKFLLGRIRSATSTGARFSRPRDFDPVAYLHGSLGRFTGEQDHEVRIALDEIAAFYARERPWHRSQTITPRPDGRTEIALRLNNLVDVENAVLRCGAHAEVLAPPELRDRVRTALAAALARYA